MSEDTEHEKYFQEHPSGNHDEPAGETIRFMEKQNEINEKLNDGMSRIENKVDIVITKLTYTNGKVGEQEKFKNTYESMLQTLVEERKRKKHLWDDWKVQTLALIVATIVSTYFLNHFIK